MSTQPKVNVIACLLRARRPELANAVAAALVRAAPQTPADLLQSLNSLAKNNQGLWKSEKQGQFLWTWADRDKSLRPGRDAVAWAKKTGRYDTKDRTQRVLQFVTSLQGYGVRDPSKIRYTGTYVLLDGTGVLAVGSVKVQHPTKQDPGTMLGPIPGTAKTRFVRPANVVPTITLDPRGEERKRRAAQLRKNQPVIKAIESIPGWRDQSIFQDFHALLMKGGTLTPKQMAVVERNVPRAVVDVGSADELVDTMNQLDRWFETSVLPPMIEAFVQQDKPNEDSEGRIKDAWAQYKAGKGLREIQDDWVLSHLMDSVEEVLRYNIFRETKGARGTTPMDAGYTGFRTELAKALPALKRGKPPSKTSMIWIRAMLRLAEKARGVGPEKFRKYWEKR